MGVARRVYLYTVSFVALAAVAIGVHDLLALFVGRFVDESRVIVGESGEIREQASFAIALVVVGLPVWLIHWWLVLRGSRGGDARAMEERGSAVRSLDLNLVRAITAAIFVSTALSLGSA